MARGGDPFVERVREATDLADVVSAHVQLKKAGARLQGLCPFHHEKTPSFSVDPSLQAWYCFGCGAGGDVFSFVMQYEKMSFPEALHHLAERAGIPIPQQRSTAGDTSERVREALKVARAFFADQLASRAGEAARAYLQRRGLPPEMWARYGIGYAPELWDGLLRQAGKVVSERTLVEAGLALESESGRIYDRFRNRVMIPIESIGGATVGFGGRILGDEEPKYLNSPETVVYHKGSVLFGAGAAREGIRRAGRVVVVEGYFDVISLHQAGVEEAVGTCGTALTPAQAVQLRRLADQTVLLFDGDNAGTRATLRAIPILAGEIGDVRVVRPPVGVDPDLWVRQEGGGAVRSAIDRAQKPLGFLESLVAAGAMPLTQAAHESADWIGRITDPLSRDLWFQEAAGRFPIGIEGFWEAVRRGAPTPTSHRRGALPGGPSEGPSPRLPRSAAGPSREGTSTGQPAGSGPAGGMTRLAVACLRTALERPAWAARLLRGLEDWLPEEGAGAVLLLRWISAQPEAQREGGADSPSPGAGLLSRALREVDDPVLATALQVLSTEGARAEDPAALLRTISNRGLEQRKKDVQREIRRAQDAGDEVRLKELLDEKHAMARHQADLWEGKDRSGGPL